MVVGVMDHDTALADTNIMQDKFILHDRRDARKGLYVTLFNAPLTV